MNHSRMPFEGFHLLQRTMYVIVMGWPRWGREARVRWLENMRDDCLTCVEHINELLVSDE